MEADDLDGFAFAGPRIETGDVGVVDAGGEVDYAISLGTDQGPELPMSERGPGRLAPNERAAARAGGRDGD